MIGWFKFGDADTRNYEHVIVCEGEVDSAPVRLFDEVVVAGKNGTLLIDTGRYDNVLHSYDIIVHEEYLDSLIQLRNDLQSQTGYQTLIDNFNSDESYIARLDSSFIPKQTRNRNAGSLHVEFSRFPQRYLRPAVVKTYTRSGGVITNPTLFEAKPLLKVTGAGTFTIGDSTMTVLSGSGSSQTIYIDCETMEAWEELDGGGIISRNDYIQSADGKFPTIKAGDNDVIVGSGITFLYITPRWWRI